MNTPNAVAEAYIQTWNETDTRQRDRLFRTSWTDDARYVDPMMRAEGAAQISGLVAAVHQRFAGFRFSLRGDPSGHGDYVRFSWALGPGAGEAPIEGTDVVKLIDGKIQEVIGFLDKVPATA